mgnify:CR=1 FL=1
MATSDRRVGKRQSRRLAAIPIAILIVLVVAYLVAEGNLTEGFVDLRDWFYWFFRHYGAPGSLGLLYVEESGLPLPVPGDVYVVYLGHLAQASVPPLVQTWPATIPAAPPGSTNTAPTPPQR